MTHKILAVLAHPDDESFGLGGTLALYSRRGHDTYLICSTGGEEGSMDDEYLDGYKDKAELRAAELMKAAEHLGLKDVYLLGYRDSGMPGTDANRHPDAQVNHSLDEVAAKVVKYIRELRPDIVITFDPIGGYKHPDHIHIHQATVMAFEKADDASFHPDAGAPFKPRALYFQVFPRQLLRWTVRLMPLFGKDPTRVGRNRDVNLKELAAIEFPVHVRVDIRPVAEVKKLAGAAHASQGGAQMRRGVMSVLTRLFGDHEEFMRAYPPVNGRFRQGRDLFDGILDGTTPPSR